MRKLGTTAIRTITAAAILPSPHFLYHPNFCLLWKVGSRIGKTETSSKGGTQKKRFPNQLLLPNNFLWHLLSETEGKFALFPAQDHLGLHARRFFVRLRHGRNQRRVAVYAQGFWPNWCDRGNRGQLPFNWGRHRSILKWQICRPVWTKAHIDRFECELPNWLGANPNWLGMDKQE